MGNKYYSKLKKKKQSTHRVYGSGAGGAEPTDKSLSATSNSGIGDELTGVKPETRGRKASGKSGKTIHKTTTTGQKVKNKRSANKSKAKKGKNK